MVGDAGMAELLEGDFLEGAMIMPNLTLRAIGGGGKPASNEDLGSHYYWPM